MRKRKAQSIGGYIVGDRNPFILDWDKMIATKKKKAEEKRLLNRSRNTGTPSLMGGDSVRRSRDSVKKKESKKNVIQEKKTGDNKKNLKGTGKSMIVNELGVF